MVGYHLLHPHSLPFFLSASPPWAVYRPPCLPLHVLVPRMEGHASIFQLMLLNTAQLRCHFLSIHLSFRWLVSSAFYSVRILCVSFLVLNYSSILHYLFNYVINMSFQLVCKLCEGSDCVSFHSLLCPQHTAPSRRLIHRCWMNTRMHVRYCARSEGYKDRSSDASAFKVLIA